MFQAETAERSSTFVCSYVRICRQFKMVFLGHPELRTFFVLKVFKLVTHHHYNSVAWIAGTTSNFLQEDCAISWSLTWEKYQVFLRYFSRGLYGTKWPCTKRYTCCLKKCCDAKPKHCQTKQTEMRMTVKLKVTKKTTVEITRKMTVMLLTTIVLCIKMWVTIQEISFTAKACMLAKKMVWKDELRLCR